MPKEATPESVEINHGLSLPNRIGRFVGRTIFRGAVVGLFAVGCLRSFGDVQGEAGPATLESRLTIDPSGNVEGNISIDNAYLDISDGPLGAEVRMVKLDSDKLRDTGKRIDSEAENIKKPEDVLDLFKDQVDDLKKRTIEHGLAALILGGIGGMAVADASLAFLALQRKNHPYSRRQLYQKAAGALLIPSMIVSGAAANTVRTMHDNPFQQALRFGDHGSLEAIRDLTNSSIFSLENYKDSSKQLSAWLNDLITLQQNMNRNILRPDGLIPVLIIGDIHRRPCSYERAQEIIKVYGIGLGFNVGDESELGQTLESKLFNTQCDSGVNDIGDVSAPIVFIGGDHDNKQIVEEIAKYDNVTVLDGKTRVVRVVFGQQEMELRVLGISDPRLTEDTLNRPTEAEYNALLEAQAQAISKTALADKPDLIVVHSQTEAEMIRQLVTVGDTPTILSGDTHKFAIDAQKGILTTGTFGGAGLRGYNYDQNKSNNTVQATIAYFDPKTKTISYVLDLSVSPNGSISGNIIDFKQQDSDTATKNTRNKPVKLSNTRMVA